MHNRHSFEQIIKEDRAGQESKLWRGTFLEYLELVREDPTVPKLSHARIYDTIMRVGTQDILDSDDPRVKRLYKDESLKVFNFFRDEFFGIEKTVGQIVRYFHSASLKGEESRQVLYLMGPVGSGKSSLVEKLQRGLEASDPVYTIESCPMFEEPLHLIPRHLRKEFEKMLGVHIEGDLCPVCRFRLKEEFSGRYEEVPVANRYFSKRNRVGIGVVPPVDPNNQDTSVLIGSEDISKLDLYSEGDPRVLDLNGALNVGNRGMCEFIEVFKNETEYLHAMITATQEKVIPAPGRHGMVYGDTVIVAHSNEAEWQKFKADHTNEAILDRIVVVKVPYNLRLSEEVKIYQKIIRNSDFRAHVAPHTLEIASMFAILSRLQPTSKCDLMTKLKLYNGEEVVEKGKTKKIDVSELREDAKREGMTGISTRFIMKALDNALSDNVEGNCINPINVREALISMVKEADLPDDTRKQHLEFLQDVLHKEYLELLEKEITKAFVYSYQEQAEALFQNYLDHAEAFVNKTRVKDRNTKEELQPDEGFLKSIEEQIAIIGSAAEGFRQDIADINAEESIIGKDRDKVIKVPIRGIREYKFVYGDNVPGVGQGTGESQNGQVVGKAKQPGKAGEDKAGDQPGSDYYETDVTLEELIDIMFEDLELPDLERKALRQLESFRIAKRKGYRAVGIRVRLDKRRTARERVRRKLATSRVAREKDAVGVTAEVTPGTERRFPFHEDDLTYRHMTTDVKKESNAVVICIMDTSGSMDTMKKYLARSFFFLLYQSICTKYGDVEIVFIAHHTEANEVTEDEFFHKGESGGTFISSGYNKALEIIQARYHPSLWNIYAFHCSDGDNFDSDNPTALRAAKELAEVCNLFGYGEIKPLGSRYYESSMLNIFRRL